MKRTVFATVLGLGVAGLSPAACQDLLGAMLSVENTTVQRLDLDITGDGEPEVFLSTDPSPERGGQQWNAFRPLPNGGVQELGPIYFLPGYLRVDAESQRVVVLEPADFALMRRVEYAVLGERLVRVKEEVLRAQESEQDAERQEREIAALRAFQATHQAIPSVGKVVRGGTGSGLLEPDWLDPRTGRPCPGLRKLLGGKVALTTAPVVSLGFGKHLSENRTCLPEETCEVYLVELDLDGDNVQEVLLAAAVSARDHGWLIYRLDAAQGQYRSIGTVPFEPPLFRFDPATRELVAVDEYRREILTYQVLPTVGQLRKVSWKRDFGNIAQPELDRIKAFQETGVAKILRAPWREFVAAPDKVTWTSWITGKPDSPTVDLTAPVVGQ